MGQKTNATIFRLGLKNTEWKYKYLEKNTEESTLFLYKNVEIVNYINTIFKHYNLLIHSCKVEYNQDSINILILFFELKTLKVKKSEILYSTLKHWDVKKFDSNYSTDQFCITKPQKKLTLFLIKNLLTTCLSLFIKNKTINIKTQNLNKKFETKLQQNKQYFLEYKKTLKVLKQFLKTYDQKDFIKILFISATEKNSAKLLADIISIYINKHKKKHYFLFFLLKKTLTVLMKVKFSKVKGIKITIAGRFRGVLRAKKKTLTIGKLPLQSLNSPVDYYNSTSFTQNGTFGVKVWVC